MMHSIEYGMQVNQFWSVAAAESVLLIMTSHDV